MKAEESLFWEQPVFKDKPRFHYKDDIYFIKEINNGVTVLKLKRDIEKNGGVPTGYVLLDIEFQFSMDENAWSSIVTSMSKGGETAESYYKFLFFHRGE